MLTYRNVVKCLVLTIITCGIYGIYWIYKIDEDLKFELDNDNNPTLDLVLLFVTCGLYSLYLVYRNAQQIAMVEEKYGMNPTDNAILHLILAAIGLSIVAIILQQDAINKIVEGNGDLVDPLS